MRALYFFGFMFCSHCAIHLLRFPKYFFLIIYSIFKTFQYVTFILFCRAEYSKICQRVPWGGPQFVIWGHSVPDTAVGEHLRHLGHRDTGTLGHFGTQKNCSKADKNAHWLKAKGQRKREDQEKETRKSWRKSNGEKFIVCWFPGSKSVVICPRFNVVPTSCKHLLWSVLPNVLVKNVQ